MFELVQSLQNETEVNLNDQYCQHETLKMHHHWKHYAHVHV